MYKNVLLNAIGADKSPVKVSTEEFENCGECVKIENGIVELFVTKDFGPRIICYRKIGGKNIFGNLDDDSFVETELGKWKHYGGHRLWCSPELKPGVYCPDNDPVDHESIGRSTVRFISSVKDITGVRKEIYVSLDRDSCGVTVTHTITNMGLLPIEVAPWAITIMDGGGVAIVPQEPFAKHSECVQPVRPMVMWSYTDLSDSRYKIGKKYIQLASDPTINEPQKFGVMDKQGWVAYSKDQQLFVKRFSYDKSYIYPDYGCNVEVYSCGNMLELETLGQLTILKPGESSTHVERWFLFDDIELDNNEESMSKKLIPILHKTSR